MTALVILAVMVWTLGAGYTALILAASTIAYVVVGAFLAPRGSRTKVPDRLPSDISKMEVDR